MVWLVHLDHAFYQMLVINWDIYAKSMRSHDCCLLVHSDSEVNNLTAIHNGHGNLMHLLALMHRQSVTLIKLPFQASEECELAKRCIFLC